MSLRIYRSLKNAWSSVSKKPRDACYSSKAFIASSSYSDIMGSYVTKADGVNSAELTTKSFYYRHHIKNDILGAWRWLGLYENKEMLSRLVFDESKRGLDFGGARGPISVNVDVCDRLDTDLFGRPTRYNDLDSVEDGSFDYIWSSHTLEHIDEFETILERFRLKLKNDGVVFLHLPAYSCTRWRSSVHAYTDEKGDSSHRHTFCLAGDAGKARGLDSLVEIDTVVKKHFTVEKAEMCGDNSIFIVAKP